MHLLSQIIYSCKTLYMFRRSFRPSSGAQNCVTATVYVKQLLLPAAIGNEMELQELETAYTATIYVKQLLLPAAIRNEMELQELKTVYTATVYVKQLLLPAAIGDEM